MAGYRWYVFEMLAGHPLESAAWSGYWLELLRAMPIALGSSLWLAFQKPGAGFEASGLPPSSNNALWAFVLGLLLAGWIGRLHQGGYDNVLLPAVMGLALGFGPACHRLAIPGALLGIVQLALLAYSPAAQLPSREDRAAGQALVTRLSEGRRRRLHPLPRLPGTASRQEWGAARNGGARPVARKEPGNRAGLGDGTRGRHAAGTLGGVGAGR